MFRLFAQMIASHIETARKAEASHTALLDEREASALREQFIAVLGHDLRNPLAGIQGGVHILAKEQLSERGSMVLGLLADTVTRMEGIVDNVMDFARGRLGDGIILKRSRRPVQNILDQVVAELASGHPNREIVSSFDAMVEIHADHGRLGQLFSNLLANALAHGAPDRPVRAEARVVDGYLELRTVNGGEPILPSAMARLFTPFARGEGRPDQQGLGLGLYIASQIAKAHGGTLAATSTPEETVFTFRMPV
jgi:signal transduction histidine kinase